MSASLLLGPAPKGAAVAIAITTDKSGKVIPVAGLSASLMAKRGFSAKPGQTLVIPGRETKVYVGMGDVGSITTDRLRVGAASASRAAMTEPALAIDQLLIGKVDRRSAIQALVEGALLPTYTYEGKPVAAGTSRLATVSYDPGTNRAAREAAEFGEAIATATSLVRNLVNRPPADLTPTIFSDTAVAVLAGSNVEVEVWDETRIRAERLGGLLGVSQGGLEPPRLVRMVWNPPVARGAKKPPTLAIVGKGITFDSGGLSLKPADGMMTMKCDMAGAAATLGLFSLLSVIQPDIRVIGYCCLSENLPGERATKPGDVHTARNGKTFEILNTDAEGRLVLADGLSLAVEDKADAIIDLATLTGAIIVALGKDVTGLFSNESAFSSQVLTAAQRAGEPMWELPIWNPYRRHIDSDVADMKNIGSPGQAGSIVAALFLQEFVGSTPWAHLDIAGTAWTDAPNEFGPRGGTGAGLRTLVELVQRFEKP
jgi:leucyl aminopeptidase